MRVPKDRPWKPGVAVRTVLSCSGVACLIGGAESIDWASGRVVSTGSGEAMLVPLGLVLVGTLALIAAIAKEW